LRRRYEHAPHAAVTAWINFADSIIDRQLALGELSLMKMRRAYALSRAVAERPLHALTSAWLAHLYWNRQDLTTTALYAKEALLLASADDHASQGRIGLVVGEALLISGREAAGRIWYARARYHASEMGDLPSLSALAFNLAAVRAMLLRQFVLSDSAALATGRAAELQAEASRSFDHLIGTPIDSRTPIHEARILSCQGDARAALDLYVANARDANVVAAARELPEWLSDEAWCLARIGELGRAREVALSAEASLSSETQVDDRAALHSRLALVFATLGELEIADRHRTLARHLWREYRVFQDECASLFESLAVDG
jgi:hypothetical protein